MLALYWKRVFETDRLRRVRSLLKAKFSNEVTGSLKGLQVEQLRPCLLNLLLVVLAGIVLLSGCARIPAADYKDVPTYTVVPDNWQLVDFPVPAFVIPHNHEAYNRIGKVEAMQIDGEERVWINPDKPTIYTTSYQFTTSKGTYTNRVYRVHFQRIPFSLIPFNLSAGENPGILVVMTFDSESRPVLVTTVQTCGCYVALIPTDHLANDAYPKNWVDATVAVYGEHLPARLGPIAKGDLVQIAVRPDVHRVMDIRVQPRHPELNVHPAEVLDLESLKSLTLGNGKTTSLYHDTWPLAGHVKGAIKPWETLLLSLVSLDFFVGMDKEFSNTSVSGNPFYTSLKPWNRKVSDMNNFITFLKFYGWQL